jgi:lambda family phage portal protein
MGLRSAWRELWRPARPSRRAYQGANVSRLTSDWVTSSTSADSEIRSSLVRLRNRARQLTRDNDYAQAALRTIELNVVGQGIGFQSQVRMQRGAGRLDQSINDRIEQAWRRWCQADSCDVSGRLSFADIERLAMRSVAESGEIFIRLVQRPFGSSRIPLGLEVIEADQCPEDYIGTSGPDRETVMGIERDQWKRPTSYYFRTRHPGDQFIGYSGQNSELIRVPADEVIHLYRQLRPGQTRGVTMFASAIERLHHLYGYEQAEVVAARASSSLMGFITSPEGELFGDDVVNNERVADWSPGKFAYLAPGENISVPDLGHDPSGFEPFMRAMLRAVAAGIGCSYESISRDFSQTNYSSSRLSLLEDREHWRMLQSWLIANLHQRVFERWLDLAVLSGELELPRYEVDPGFYRRVRWMPRGWGWVDPTKEVEAYRVAVRSGFKTVADVIAESGGDIEDVWAARARELQMADDLDLVLDTNPAADPNAINAEVNSSDSPDPPNQPDDSPDPAAMEDSTP